MTDPPSASGTRGDPPRADQGGGRLGFIALVLATSVLLSRFLGLARESVMAGLVGAGPRVDAYNVAFIPAELLNYLLAGGALSVAFLPLYNRIRADRGEEGAQQVFAVVLGTLGLLVTVGTALLWWQAPEIIARSFPRFDAETQALTVKLSRIVLPAQICFITGGVLRSALMAHDRFRAQAAAPIFYNGAIIAGGVWTGTVEGFAWGVLAGAVLGNWLYPAWELRGFRSLRAKIAPFDLDFRAYAWIAVPLMLGVSLTTMGEVFEKFIGAGLTEATVSHLSYARKFAMAPVGVLGQAIGAAALPTFAQLWASGQGERLDRTIEHTLRVTAGLGCLAAAACVALARPVIEIGYHHGEFTAEAAARVSVLFAWMALGVPAWVIHQVGVRAFYAREDTWRPMLLGSGVVALALPLYFALSRWRGAEGLALAGALSMTANAALVLVWARVRFGGPSLLPIAGSALRATAIGALATLLAWQVQGDEAGKLAALRDLAWGGGVFGIVSLIGVFTVGDTPTRDAVRRLWQRFASRLPGRAGGPG